MPKGTQCHSEPDQKIHRQKSNTESSSKNNLKLYSHLAHCQLNQAPLPSNYASVTFFLIFHFQLKTFISNFMFIIQNSVESVQIYIKNPYLFLDYLCSFTASTNKVPYI